jgi:hypothetical protein
MRFSSMIQQIARVAAFAAIACLSLQAACTIGLPPLTSGQLESHGDSSCHESAPTLPNAPDPGHICCSGDHSPDALLSTSVTTVPLVLDRSVLGLTSTLLSFTRSFVDFSVSFSPPHSLFILRI